MRSWIFALGLAVSAGAAQAVVGPTRSDGRFAGQVLMLLKRDGRAAGFCSGVALSKDAVLTAAHCIADAANMRAHFRDEAGKPVLLPIAETVAHPGHVPDAVKKRVRTIDLALVRLADPLPARFAPAVLDETGSVSLADTFLIAGYGVARYGAGGTSGVLRVGEIAARAPVSKILLWASDIDHSGAGACTGDSGAPIYDAAGAKVVAIAAWAGGRGTDFCGSFTQGALVAPHRGWILEILRRWGE